MTGRDDAAGPAEERARLGLPPDATAEEVREAAAALTGGTPVGRTPRPRRRAPAVLLATLVMAIVVVVVQQVGQGSDALPAGHVDVSASTAGTSAVDPARKAALEATLAAHPDDVDAMAELGNLYSVALDARNARVWHELVVERRPDDPDARLALGVDLFALDDLAGAEEQWLAVTTMAPRNPEAWFNLGFLHLATDPPALDKVEAAWNRVVELAPDSDMARTVQNHLGAVGGAASTPASAPATTPGAAPATETGR